MEVSDRFGDYGLVGVMIFGARSHGAGGRHIPTELPRARPGRRAPDATPSWASSPGAAQLSQVDATFITTRKNQPARDFLEAVCAASYRRQVEGAWRYELPAEIAVTVAYRPGGNGGPTAMERAETSTASIVADAPASRQVSRERFERIATELTRPEQVLRGDRHASGGGDHWPAANCPGHRSAAYRDRGRAMPRSGPNCCGSSQWELRTTISSWGERRCWPLTCSPGSSSNSVRKLPLTSLIEASTIGQLAQLLAGAAGSDTLVLIRDGEGGPPLFLVHDGDGETMLYRNLALRLSSNMPSTACSLIAV